MSFDKGSVTITVKRKENNVFDDKTSHDIRSRLNIIMGFTELMLAEVPGKINEQQRRSLNDIMNSVQHLLGLLNDFLEHPKREA